MGLRPAKLMKAQPVRPGIFAGSSLCRQRSGSLSPSEKNSFVGEHHGSEGYAALGHVELKDISPIFGLSGEEVYETILRASRP